MIKNKKYFSLFLVGGFFVLASFLFGAGEVRATGTLTQITATPSTVKAGVNSNYTISFVTETNIAAGGKILIQFPAGFDVNGSDNLLNYTDIDLSDDSTDYALGSSASGSTWGASVSGQVVTITSGTGTIDGGSVVVVEIGLNATSGVAGDKQIVNTNTVANNYQLTITTKNSSNVILDGPTGTIYFQIFASNSETNIDGVYYLRDDAYTHYQNNGDTGAAGLVIGTLSRSAPASSEIISGYSGNYTDFYFNENGTYTQTNQLTNIYYHVWWEANNNQGTLGYDKTGYHSFGNVTTENFATDVTNSPNKVGEYYLYAGKQNLASPQSIFGNAIYNLGIKFTSWSQYPNVISYANQASFIIVNLPDDATLRALDSDGDGLSDYDELFTYYTNPYGADTDSDGFSDKYEVDNSLDPVDPEVVPVFGKPLLKQYSGEAGSSDLFNEFGTSVSTISDIDGDGKEDVLVGSGGDGYEHPGYAYIYSSGTGNVIKKYEGSKDYYLYDGDENYDGFGYSISSIGDVDGDGKDDVLVGAPYAGVVTPNDGDGIVYIYSSGTGDLIRQYDGTADGGYFGSSVASISDMDGDGKDDVVIGAYAANSGDGAVYIYSSGTGSLIKQFNPEEASAGWFGSSIASILDIDGDGKEDVVIGAKRASPGGKYDAGSVYIYSSGTGNLIKQYNGGVAGDYFGTSVSTISDIDGDGKEDVLVGDPGDTYPVVGSVYIYSSGTGNLIKQYNGAVVWDYFGHSVSSISDVDGDGKDDVVVGAFGADLGIHQNAGAVYIYSSGTGSLIKQYNGTLNDNGYSSRFGVSVSSIGDVDGDGKDDVVIGAPYYQISGVDRGSVYIYSSVGNIPPQSWSKGSTKANVFDLDDYFIDSNNSTIPARNQTVIYTASASDNEIDVSIGVDNKVSFSVSPGWSGGTESVTFTATDSTGLSSASNPVQLTVIPSPSSGGGSSYTPSPSSALAPTPTSEPSLIVISVPVTVVVSAPAPQTVAQIKSQLISLITQVIQILTQRIGEMGK